MANDRIYIRCTTCQQQIMLTKYFPGSLSERLDDDRAEKVVAFMREHLNPEHHPNGYSETLKGNPGLVFVTESSPQSD